MLTLINNAIVALADPLLGWLLRLPGDAALLIVAVGTGAILTFSRLLCTNQDLLRRCARDKRRLKQLTREAKQQGDRPAVRRMRSTQAAIALMTLRAEGWPLLAAIVPIAVLGTWCFQRLACVPPKEGEVIPLMAYFPVSAAGQVAHLVADDGVEAVAADGAGADRWIVELAAAADPAEGPPHALGTWHLKARARPEPYVLEIRYRTHTVCKELLVGQPRYSEPIEFYGPEEPLICSEVALKELRLFGLVPGVPWLGLPPWLVAYFLVAIPSVSLIKRIAGIH